MTTTPQLGDVVHFQRICAVCNDLGQEHFTFVIDDPELLAILPRFRSSQATHATGRPVTLWLDHDPDSDRKFGRVFSNLKSMFGRKKAAYDDTYLIVLADDTYHVMGPSRTIVPAPAENLRNPRVRQIVESMEFTHFNYLDLTTSISEQAQDIRATSSMDQIAEQKQDAVHELVQDAIIERRRELGLSQLMNSAALGRAALWVCQKMVATEVPESEQVKADFQRAAGHIGYGGLEVGVSHYRQSWPLDTPNEQIVQHILQYFDGAASGDFWEDWGFGVTRGTFIDQQTGFGFGVVFGVGYTDGNALVTNYINEARQQGGVQPLELDHRLRNLARDYLALYSEPDTAQIRKDIEEYGYLREGITARWAYSGVYARIPVASTGLDVRDIARLVADELLSAERELLMRADWQDIGIAVRTDPVLPPDDAHVPDGPSIQAEFLVGWRLTEGVARPAHFPPPAEPQ